MKAKLSAVLFDLDGTLLDEKDRIEALMKTSLYLSRRVKGVSYERLYESICRVAKEMDKDYDPSVHTTGKGIRLLMWKRALTECGINDDKVHKLAVDYFSEQRKKGLKLVKDAKRILKKIKKKYKIALVTNAPNDTQMDKIVAVGLNDIFDEIVISGAVGTRKPSKRIFEIALERIGSKPENAVHVGDKYEDDIVGAKSAGLNVVLIGDGKYEEKEGAKPDFQIRELKELLGILEL